MSRTKTTRPVLLALLGLLVIVAMLRPITPSAASDTDVNDDAEVVVDEEATSTTIVEETTSTTVVEENATTTSTAAPADEETDASDDPAADDETPDPTVTEEDDATETDVEPVDDGDSDEADVKTTAKDKKTPKPEKQPEPDPNLAVSKTVVSGPTVDASGNYTITYRISVTNSGGASDYKLEDALYFGGGISITSTEVTNSAPGNITANGSWNGLNQETIVANEPIAADATHIYQIVVRGAIDPAISTAAGDCDTTTGGFNTGFLNGILVTAGNSQQDWDAACAEVPEALAADMRVSKRAQTGPTYNAAGNYELTYDIVVTNDGTGAGEYDLGDRIFFGDGIVIVSSSISNVIPGTIATNPTWNGITRNQVALGVPIGAGEAHTYRVFIEANVSPDITDDAKDCVLDHGEEGTGFLNKALIRVDGEDANDWDCREVPDPEIGIEKTLTSGPTLNGAGNYDVSYDVVVSNTGQGPGVYDLSDELTFGDGITVVDASVANTVPGTVTSNASWDGLTDLVVATGVGIVPLSSHTYTVTVEASVAATTTGTARDCELDQGEDGTGFLNVATITVDGVDTSDDDCGQVPGPVITIDKTLTSGPTLNGAGNYDVSYDVAVSNTGDGPGVYDLSDELTYGDGITVVDASVANTVPGSITTNASWDGLTDLVVATGVDITAGDAHTYTVTVEASVAATTTTTARDCVVDQDEDGTGFLNVATITVDGVDTSDDDCAEVPGPEWELTKALTSGPTLNGAGNYDVSYDVVVSNIGDGPGVYDLSDELTYGDGITVVDASVANTVPGSITTNASWDGLTDLVVATGVATGPGETHTYTVTVEASVAATTTATARDCVVDQDEDGTGFLNTATLTFDGGTLEDEDCGTVPGPEWELTKALTSGPTLNGAGNYDVSYDVVVSNIGDGPGVYDLSDELTYGDGITVVDASVANTVPGSITTNASWDGLTDLVVATGVATGPGEKHTYTVTVEASVAATTTATARDCVLDQDEDGTGFLNTATLTFDGGTLEDEDCGTVPGPELELTKDLTSVVANDDGTNTVTYRIVVDSVGAGPTTYDLSDELKLGEGITIDSAAVVNDTPGSITTNAGWDGVADLVVATGVDIAAGEQHVYLVAVVVTVSAGITETAADCDLTTDEDGTGYLNTATLTYEDVTLEDEDCAPVDPDDEPTIEVQLEAVCDNDIAWLAYEIVAGEGITATTATVTMANAGESQAFVVDLGSGRILWPGTELDDAGEAIDWPGWDQDADGNWFLNPDNPYTWAHGDVEVTVEVNPTYGPETVTYPPAEPTCDAAPPTDDDPDDDPNGDDELPHTGMSTTLFGSIGLAMLALGSMLVLKVRRRQEDV